MSQHRSSGRISIKWLWLAPLLLTLVLMLLPVVLIASMRWIDPISSMFMQLQHYTLRQEKRDANIAYHWVDAENITPKMMLAVVAAEDQKFPNHFGFDLEAIEKAMAHNRGNKKVRGASTISQQVAKNLFLWPSRSWLRKGMEVYYTSLIELFWSKQRIVEVYVNIAQFDDNVFGVGAASAKFFKKSPAKLTLAETALLAAVLPSPARYHAQNPSAFVMRRANWIQQQMVGLGDDYIATGVVAVGNYQRRVTTPDQLPAEIIDEPIDNTLDAEAVTDEVPDAEVVLPEVNTDSEITPPETANTEILPSDTPPAELNTQL